jgi:exosortase/archaeosortase family protein
MRSLAPTAVALLIVAIAAAVVTQQTFVRGLEARTGATVAGLLGLVPARAVGSAVVFPLEGRFVGYAVTEGCTVTFLLVPFCIIAAALVVSRRVPPARGLSALAVAAVTFFIANQARLFLVAASMRLWGFQSGYERSHVFLGTLLTTVGVVAGLLLFVSLVVREPNPSNC